MIKLADITNMYIDSLDTNGKKVQRSITNLNPDATNNQLRALAIGINALSTNTFGSATKVERTDLQQQTERTISFTQDSYYDLGTLTNTDETHLYVVSFEVSNNYYYGEWYLTDVSMNGIDSSCEVGLMHSVGAVSAPSLYILTEATTGTVSGTVNIDVGNHNNNTFAPASFDFSLNLQDAAK